MNINSKLSIDISVREITISRVMHEASQVQQVRGVIHFLLLFSQTPFEWGLKQIQQVGVNSWSGTVWLKEVSSSMLKSYIQRSGLLALPLVDKQLRTGWGLFRRWASCGIVCLASTNVTIVVVRIEGPVRSADSSANKDCCTNGLFWGNCFDVFTKGDDRGDILCEPRVRFYSLFLKCRLLLRDGGYNRRVLWDVSMFPIAHTTEFLCKGMSLTTKVGPLIVNS